MDLDADLDLALTLAAAAGAVVLRIYREGFAVQTKGDGSPVTAADLAANALIVDGLRAARPDDAVLSEEAPFRAGDVDRVWMVDPLDGTSDFAGHTDDFSVMIGLCVAGIPAVGVVAAPALGRTWAGVVGVGAFELVDGVRRPVRAAVPPTRGLRVLSSRKHPPPGLARVLAALEAPTRIPRGSVGIKTGLVVSGDADLYLHPAPGTHLWDCCAPEAIARAAGAIFSRPTGAPVPYDPARTPNPAGVLVAHPKLHARVAAVIAAGP